MCSGVSDGTPHSGVGLDVCGWGHFLSSPARLARDCSHCGTEVRAAGCTGKSERQRAPLCVGRTQHPGRRMPPGRVVSGMWAPRVRGTTGGLAPSQVTPVGSLVPLPRAPSPARTSPGSTPHEMSLKPLSLTLGGKPIF